MSQGERSIQDKTAAENKSIGFDYQYYFFLYKMIQLESGQSIGYEVKDDVHIEHGNGELVLIQLKHSIDEKANLTEKDVDLWKTISNWIKMINDSTQGRTNLASQIKFIKKTTFLLVTNKSSTLSNNFLNYIDKFCTGEKTLIEIKKHLVQITTLSKGKTPSQVDGYITYLLSQDDTWLEAFLKNLKFLLSKDSLIDEIKMKIKEKNVPDNRIDDVYEAIDSNLRSLIYNEVKDRKKVTISFIEYYNRFTKFYEIGRRKQLLIRGMDTSNPMPSDPLTYTSIKQLIDAEIMDQEDVDFKDELIKIFTRKFLMHNNEMRWMQDSEITNEELKKFNNLAKSKWENKFNKIHASLKKQLRNINLTDIDTDKLNDLALECYHEVLEIKLTLDDTDLETDLSNGKFYLLSDQPCIGWLYDWKGRYK